MDARSVAVATAVCLAGSVLAGCGATASTVSSRTVPASVESTAGSPALAVGPLVADYVPGLPAQVRVPDISGPSPLVVLVPGGGWSSADPSGLVPLAEYLTDAGATTSLITYSTTAMGATFPRPVDDVACAVRWSAQRAAELGGVPTHVVVVGHSAGGHLATLVALSGDEFGGACPAPAVAIDGVVGLAGVYDTTWDIGALDAFFGARVSPDERAAGSPLVWARQGVAIPAGLRVLLIHGDADDVVPLEQTSVLAAALREPDVDLAVEILPAEDHMTVIRADVAGPAITTWLGDWR